MIYSFKIYGYERSSVTEAISSLRYPERGKKHGDTQDAEENNDKEAKSSVAKNNSTGHIKFHNLMQEQHRGNFNQKFKFCAEI